MDVQSLGRPIAVGDVSVAGRVWLAPMTGVTDLAFREVAAGLGAAYLATEMVACAQFAQGRPDAVRRAAVGEGLPLMVVQLVGRDPALVAAAARLARQAGAQIVDLNFGCPAKEVTGHLSGSALMRDTGLAREIVAAAADAVDVPVTVKMRLGWDDGSINAPALAALAVEAGARAITVHARTRNQFYGGAARWSEVRAVKEAVDVPVLVNGDIVDAESARSALGASGADGVMIGRAAVGRPWIAGIIEAALNGRPADEPGPDERLSIVIAHLNASVRLNGALHGVRLFRKHLAAYVEGAPWSGPAAARRQLRGQLCRLETAGEIIAMLSEIWSASELRAAA